MNSKNGKLLVLGGFGIRMLMNGLYFLESVMNTHYFISGSLIGLIINLLSTLVIVGGFAIAFLSDRDIFDLIIAGGFATQGLYAVINYVIWGSLQVPNAIISIAILMLDLIVIAAVALWAFKLYRNGIMIGALALVAAVAIPYVTSFAASLGGISIDLLASIASCAGYIAAAFLDWSAE